MAHAKAFYFVRLVFFLCAAFLVGCAETGVSTFQTLKHGFTRDRGAAVDAAKLDPRYRYLRVTHEGGVALMLLNFIDPHPNGPIEVWYSADAQVFRFQDGRLAGNTGLLPEWRSVQLPKFPAWSSLAAQPGPFVWERVRDVMPGYRFGVRDKLILSVISPPRSSALVGTDAASLTWFEERTEGESTEQLPPARYALRGDAVVYGEQCVSPRNCFKWQRWPAGS